MKNVTGQNPALQSVHVEAGGGGMKEWEYRNMSLGVYKYRSRSVEYAVPVVRWYLFDGT